MPQRGDELVVALGVQREVARQLGVGRLARDLCAALDVAQERHVGHAQADEAGRERGGGQREPAALAEAVDSDTPGVDERMLGRGLERPHRIGVEAAEVIRLGRADAARHDARVLGARGARARIAGRARHPLAALATGVHHEHGVAGRGKQRVVDGVGATAAVADVVDEAGQRAGGLTRTQEPPRIGSPPWPLDVTSSTASAP